MTEAERAARECVKVVADALIEIGYDRDKVECEEMESAYLEFVPVIERAIEESRGQRWIPVEEKLPEERGWYLVYGGHGITDQALYAHKTGFIPRTGIKPTHWQPLPDPPKVSPAKSPSPPSAKPASLNP